MNFLSRLADFFRAEAQQAPALLRRAVPLLHFDAFQVPAQLPESADAAELLQLQADARKQAADDAAAQARVVARDAASADAVRAAIVATGGTFDPATTYQGDLTIYPNGAPILVGIYADGIRRDVLGHTLNPDGTVQ